MELQGAHEAGGAQGGRRASHPRGQGVGPLALILSPVFFIISKNNLREANHEEMNFHFARPYTVLTVALLDEIGLMNCDVKFFTDEVYEVRKLH